MKQIDHPNCVQLFEVIDDEQRDELYLVMEFIDGGDLGSNPHPHPHLHPGSNPGPNPNPNPDPDPNPDPNPNQVVVASAASSLRPSPRRGFTPTAQQARETAALPLPPSTLPPATPHPTPNPHRALSSPPAPPTHAAPARVHRWWSW